jgi:inorganic pyrophosphatase
MAIRWMCGRDPRYEQIHTLDQIFPHVRREIEHFFNIYKELEAARPARWRGAIRLKLETSSVRAAGVI